MNVSQDEEEPVVKESSLEEVDEEDTNTASQALEQSTLTPMVDHLSENDGATDLNQPTEEKEAANNGRFRSGTDIVKIIYQLRLIFLYVLMLSILVQKMKTSLILSLRLPLMEQPGEFAMTKLINLPVILAPHLRPFYLLKPSK